jgi:hypothetical protein
MDSAMCLMREKYPKFELLEKPYLPGRAACARGWRGRPRHIPGARANDGRGLRRRVGAADGWLQLGHHSKDESENAMPGRNRQGARGDKHSDKSQ